MKIEPQITLRGIDDAALEGKIRQRVQRLERYCDDIQRCQVWVEAPSGHHRQGRLHEVRIRITVPDEELAVDDQPREEDLNVAVRNAFDAARRQLEDFARRRRGDVKAHRGRAALPPAVEGGE